MAAALAASTMLSACSNAHPGPRPSATPSAADVLKRFTDALGGERAIMRPHSITMKSVATAYESGRRRVRVPVTVYLADFKRLQIAKLGRLTYLSGYDGRVAWALGPGGKVQIVRGNDAASARRDADMYYWAHVSRYFKSMSVDGVENFAGHRCYHLRGTTLWGNENNQYYDVRTGLLIGYRFHQWINGRAEDAESRQVFERYKPFGGISFATRESDFRNNRLVAVQRLTSVTYDDVDSRVFTPPPAVRRLER